MESSFQQARARFFFLMSVKLGEWMEDVGTEVRCGVGFNLWVALLS